MSLLSTSIRRQGPLAAKVYRIAAERERERNRERLAKEAAELAERVRLKLEKLERERLAEKEAAKARAERLAALEALAMTPANARRLASDIAHEHGFRFEDIIGPRRLKSLIVVRHKAVVAVADAFPLMSLTQIGRVFKRDHTTILHVLRKCGAWPRMKVEGK